MIFKTQSGSTYEVDLEKNQIRRICNLNNRNPTQHQGQDGEWKSFVKISAIEIGRSVMVTWSFEPTDWASIPAMQTSVVINISENLELN